MSMLLVVQCDLWSIIGDSGFVVSSVVSSASASFSFHMLTGKMGTRPKHIDELVATRNQKQAELLTIGHKIASSATPIVVAFVDLAESTQMKQDHTPEEWLGYVFEFIQRVDQLARGADGTVVKRIGDELMVTFNDVQASERFVDSLISDTALQIYRYKIAV